MFIWSNYLNLSIRELGQYLYRLIDVMTPEREREIRQEMEMILYYEKTRLQRVGLRAKD